VLVIQFLSTNCVYCIKSVPAFNEIFQTIEEDQNLLKRIKILAISAGDTPVEVAAFKEQHAVPYPIIPDTEFKAHKAVNEPTVPFIVVTKRDKQGKWVVATVHVGLTFSAESFVGELRAILEIDPNTLKRIREIVWISQPSWLKQRNGKARWKRDRLGWVEKGF